MKNNQLMWLMLLLYGNANFAMDGNTPVPHNPAFVRKTQSESSIPFDNVKLSPGLRRLQGSRTDLQQEFEVAKRELAITKIVLEKRASQQQVIPSPLVPKGEGRPRSQSDATWQE